LCILSRRAAVVNRNCRYFAPGLRLFRLFSSFDAHHGVKIESELAADSAKLRERGVVDGDAVFELFIAGVDLHFAGGVNAGAAFGLGAVAQLLQKRRKALAHRGLVAEHAVIEREKALRCVAEAVLAHMVGRCAAGDDRGENFYDQRETVALVRAG